MCQVMESSKAFSSANLDRPAIPPAQIPNLTRLVLARFGDQTPGHSTLAQFALGNGQPRISYRGLCFDPRRSAEARLCGCASRRSRARRRPHLPLTVPHLPPDAIRALRGIAYPETACAAHGPFVDKDFDHGEMNALTTAAYSGFRHAATAPLTQVDTICSRSSFSTDPRWPSRILPCSGWGRR